jgi:predicted phage terminase large subunit-like protein
MAEKYRENCEKCGKTTPHYTDTRKCVLCVDAEGLKLQAATREALKKRKKIAKAAKTSKSMKKTAAKNAPVRAKRVELSRQKKAQQEMYRRELAKRHLLAFVKRYEPNYLAGWVHKKICDELMAFSEAVCRGESPRLMITMPPRHGKSMLASQYWPAWHLGNHPEHEFINTSYAQSLQMDFSRKIQELIKTPDYHLLFGNYGITKKNEAVERWSLFDYDKERRTGGGVLAAGVGGPITGRGAHIFLIDDPVKNRDEAESQTIRETAKSWYSSTAYTRLAPGAGIVVIQTRWHDDDLSGWLLNEMREAEKEMIQDPQHEWPEDADRWRVVDFPAIATQDEEYRLKGEALHEDRYDLKALRRIKRTLAPRDWAALYQQNPQVEEGAYFQKKYFRMYKDAPPYLDIYCAGDLAISKRSHADWSVFIVCGMDDGGRVYMLEEYRGRWDSKQIIDVMFEIHKTHHPRRFGLEKGQISLTMDKFLEARMEEEKIYDLHVEELPPGKQDKELRARVIQGLMSHGKVYWPEGALWVDDYMNEMLRFPTGVKDDRVDAAAWVGRMVAGEAYVGAGRPKKPDKSWKKKLKGYVSGIKSTNDAMAA